MDDINVEGKWQALKKILKGMAVEVCEIFKEYSNKEHTHGVIEV